MHEAFARTKVVGYRWIGFELLFSKNLRTLKLVSQSKRYCILKLKNHENRFFRSGDQENLGDIRLSYTAGKVFACSFQKIKEH